MSNDLIPELHDCLKLTTLQHNFSDFDRFLKYVPNTRTWQGVLQHHCKTPKEGEESFPAWPADRETFLLHISDGMAANFSRHKQSYKGEKSFALYKLWNPDAIKADKRLKEDNEIIDLLNFYGTDPTFEEFDRRYGYILRSRAEDAHAGMNITTLYTHLVLTGKFYRFFKKSETLRVDDIEIIPTVERIAELRENKIKSWQIYLAKCKFHFNQKPVRARDMNIFEHLEDTISQIENEFYDNLLFSSSDEILIYFDDQGVLEKIKAIAKENGLWVSIVWVRRPLIEMKSSDPSKLTGNRSEHLYESLPLSMTPPICEICQMAPAAKIWPSDYLIQFGKDLEILDERTENLCDYCFSIRSRPSKLKKLKKWTETENISVLWIKFNLDYDLLTKMLHELYLAYLRKSNSNARAEDTEVRFSLIYEFQQDYNRFLEAFRNDLLKLFSTDSVETILKGMMNVKIEKRSEVFKTLNILDINLANIFPEFRKLLMGPIKVALVCCNSKFPFFEVWRSIENQTSNLQISLIGHGKIETSLNYLEQMLVATEKSYRKSSLYKLAEISRLSESLAELKFNDRSERGDFESYEVLKRHLLPLGMDFGSILTFAKLIED
jgi:hypothetical protein